MKHIKLLVALLIGLAIWTLSGCTTPTPVPPSPTPTATVVPTVMSAPNALKIRVSQFPPQYYQDPAGRWTGLDAELARALVEAAGFTPEFVERPWSRALAEMETGELQIMMNLSQTPERAVFMEWIGPERTGQMVLVVKQINAQLPIVTVDDLVTIATQQQSMFGIQQNAFYSEDFNARLEDPQFAKWFDAIADVKLNPKKTTAGHILGFFEDKDSVKYQILHNPDYQGLVIHSFVLSTQDVYFGLSKPGVPPTALKRLQEAYARLEKDGTFAEIRNRDWK